jgi:SSS family solute:Na+ symporter
MNLLPVGLKGVAFAALTAAIVASLAGKANSISTIFSLDLYKKYLHKNASDRAIVRTGRWAVIVSLVIAGIIAPALQTLDQAYQFIQEYIGFIAPGVLAIFLLGLYWKRTTAQAALVGALLTIPVSTILKFLPGITSGRFPDYPFIDRMSITFVFIVVVMVAISVLKPEREVVREPIVTDPSMFRVTPAFIIGSVLIIGILAALYIVFW